MNTCEVKIETSVIKIGISTCIRGKNVTVAKDIHCDGSHTCFVSNRITTTTLYYVTYLSFNEKARIERANISRNSRESDFSLFFLHFMYQSDQNHTNTQTRLIFIRTHETTFAIKEHIL